MNKSKTRQEKRTDTRNSIVRLILVVLACALQVWWICFAIGWLNRNYGWSSLLLQLVALGVVLYIFGRHTNANMKLPWIILIQVFPLPGIICYYLMGRKGANRRMRQRFEQIDAVLMPMIHQDEDALDLEIQKSPAAGGISTYLSKFCGYPVYHQTRAEFMPDAALVLDAMLKDLKKAKHFIFMEYHAIEDAEAFAGIHEVLKQKAAEGVDVRLFYDDIGSIAFVGRDFVRRLESDGIRCRVFNPVQPLLNIFMNNRDHRKITVIDGEVAYTGGFNLANEYFHITEPYGYWKDNGVRLSGDCVESFTVMFLEMWNAIRPHDQDDAEFRRFFRLTEYRGEHNGFVQPYADSPLDGEPVGENVYMEMLNRADHYCWFSTPYLILTDDMTRAFTNAAKRGVDVRIVTPGIPDKKITYQFTRSYYQHLIEGGVRIFEYTPGFNHAKLCVCDGIMATCGTINLDYRSLYHHFENGVFLYDNQAVTDIRKDFDSIFAVSTEVTEQYRYPRSVPVRIIQCIARLFAPLL
ncbi:MAG TPA: cardiolipin synthase [Lachnospiraceae bacterium]|jgi:cardiolipin synthase|nr:cardiolipin synthase [Lachnospiraceae bacterium]